jgi:peptidoglycan/LPS O-acetylase OafA/YrhL
MADVEVAEARESDPLAPAAVPPTPDPRTGFRPDIEGLRAVAVALVVLYHAGVPWLQGGYVGVDVFFVVSGFLITGLLTSELRRSGTVSLSGFYARRMRRLLPASVLVLVVTVVLVKLLLPPLASVGIRSAAMATALYASNIHFAAEQTQYLGDVAPSPLLHYWSLGVEEQFYLCWPLLLLVASKLRIGSATRRLAIVVGAVGIVSFVACIAVTSSNQPYAFFLLPTRAWELAAGAGLALGAAQLRRLSPRVAATTAWVGLAAIVGVGLVYDARTLFPGAAALLPALPPAAVSAGAATRPAGGPEGLLSRRPFVVIGRWSYSLYLWHWPLLVLPAMYRAEPLPAWTRAGLVLASVVAAGLTYVLVEDRFRRLSWLASSRARSFALGGVLTAAALVAGYLGGVLPRLDAGRPAAAAEAVDFVPSDLRPSLRGAFDDEPETWRNGCNADIPDTVPKGCVYGDPDGDRTVVLFGDSHAASWFEAFRAAADDAGWRLLTLTKNGCPAAAVPQWRAEVGRAYTECDRWRAAAIELIAKETKPTVVLAGSRESKVDVPERDVLDAWERGYADTIAALPDDADVVVLADTPNPILNPAVCLSGHLTDIDACALDRHDVVDESFLAMERDAATRNHAHFVDTTPWVCASFPCPVIRGNLLVFRDASHLASPFSASLASEIRDALGR